MKRTILITGASRGIGLELARQLFNEGHHIIATVRDKHRAKELEGLSHHGKIHPDARLEVIELDVTSQPSVAAMGAHLSTYLKKSTSGTCIDMLINNAGVLLETEAPLEELSIDQLRASFETNTLGPARVTQAMMTFLQRSKQPVVANMSSLMGSIGDNKSGKAYGYRLSKAALNMFTKNLALDYPGLIAVCLHPGWVQTDMGGENALITPEESVHGLINVLNGLKPSDTSCFFDFRGKKLEW